MTSTVVWPETRRKIGGKTPLKTLNKDPDYFMERVMRRTSGFTMPGTKTAVEQLEESKADYVKSQKVLNRQQRLKNAENLQVGFKTKNISTHCKWHDRIKSIDHQSYLEERQNTGCHPSVHSQSLRQPYHYRTDESTPGVMLTHARPVPKTNQNTALLKRPSHHEVEVERKMNKIEVKDMKTEEAKESKTNTRSISDTPPPKINIMEPGGRTTATWDEYRLESRSTSALIPQKDNVLESCDNYVTLRPRKITIQRSRSDLSHRFNRNSAEYSDFGSRLSRTSTDLERFFNEMGLDGSTLDAGLHDHSPCRDESIHFFECASSIASPANRSICSGDSRRSDRVLSELDIHDRNSCNSVVERNARIIKWLCSVRKARSKSTSELE